jgi:hypothetical protein
VSICQVSWSYKSFIDAIPIHAFTNFGRPVVFNEMSSILNYLEIAVTFKGSINPKDINFGLANLTNTTL